MTITKRLKKIGQILGLILIRQGFFLGRNVYSLIYQPYLTIKEVWEKKDKSQMFLLGVTTMTPLLAYGLSKIIYDLIKYRQLLWQFGAGLQLVLMAEILIFGYLGYWIYKVYRVCK